VPLYRRSLLRACALLALAFCSFDVIAFAQTSAVRVAVITRFADVLQDAAPEFEKTYGAGLIELSVSDGAGLIAADKLINADVIFVYHVGAEVYEQLNDPVQTAVRRGAKVIASPPDGMERFWKLKPDLAATARGEMYWSAGGSENLVSLLAYLYRAGGGKKRIAVPEVSAQVKAGIWHPRADTPFLTLDEYLRWYRAQRIVPAGAPLAAIHFLPNNYKVGDLSHIRALTTQLERAGVGVIPAFAWPLKNMRPLMTGGDGRTPARLILALNLIFSKQDDAEDMERYDVPVMNLMTTRESAAEWKQNPKGLPPGQLTYQVVAPERMGAGEPILVATTEKIVKRDGSEVYRTQPIDERVQAVAKRAQRWLILQEKPNAEKHIALIYYNNPPGKGNLGASYLNLMPSMLAIIERMRREGYATGEALQDAKALVTLLERTGRNIEQWAPGELDELSTQGVVLWPLSQYRKRYKTLPAEFRAFVESDWGQPEDSKLMLVTLASGERAFVLPGVRFGNLFLGPQPLRSTFERATNIQHDPRIPPPHSYIAAYLWQRYEFNADAIVHVGRHGTLEWLPGKSIAQLGSDSSEVLLGDVPDPYFYIMDGDGEALQARRRGAAVLMSHLTPLNVAAGEHSEYEPLHKLMDQYMQTVDEAPQVAEEYRKQIIQKVRELKIDKHLGMDLETLTWEKARPELHKFLHEIEDITIPIGQHTIGSPAPENIQRDALQEFLRTAFLEDELPMVSPVLRGWAQAVFDGRQVELPSSFSPKLRDRANAALNDGKRWMEDLRRSPALELDSIVKVLGGRFIPSGIVGDPLRSPASLPSGRNLHDFDPALIPTKAAWEVGKRLAAQTIAGYKAETGKHPEKVSLVMWSGETGRSQGVMESEAMYLLGVEPKWNARGQMDGLRLMTEEELGRPRVDVLLNVSGLYRDTLPEKVIWLDRAARLAASAQDKQENVIRKHDREVAAALKREGVSQEQAEAVAKARAFSQAPGAYGTGGLEKIVEQSKDEGKGKGLAEAYLNAMNHAYSESLWGKSTPKAFDHHLKGNQLVIHSRASNLYGISDNDDVYQYMGGLNMATKAVNDGAAPQMFINNLRQNGAEKVEGFRAALVKELSTRLWNKKWIEGQLTAGYAGARQFAKDTEYLYGWQATSPEQMNGSMWQETFDVYVADKHGLKLDEFYAKNNAHAQQWQLARLLEVDHQGTYKFSEADRGELVKRYVKSVIANGAACSANTCGNAKLHEFIAAEAPQVAGLSEADMQAFGAQMAKATHWQARDFAAAPTAFQAGLIEGLGNQSPSAQAAQIPPPARAAARNVESAPTQSNAPAPIVSGYTMEVKTMQLMNQVKRALPTSYPPFVGVIAFILLGLWWERRRRTIA
jgi:cobaltochelatase CobN